ncbi:MAG: hypothetical protein QOH61_2455 [Chloroflexota bacterium]|nr:hypothetical protein [Chloroflexota bacterium]
MPDKARDWASLPRKAKAFRIAHATAAIVNLTSLGNIWLCAATRRRNRLLGLSVGLLLSEGGALLIGRGNCPLGAFQRSLGDPVPLFELVLPPRAAKAAIPLLAGVTLAAFATLAARPALPSAPTGSPRSQWRPAP